jgi:hypothetical protein
MFQNQNQNQKHLLKIILILLLFLNSNSSVFMESLDEKLSENNDSPNSWYLWFLKHKIKFLIISGVFVSILLSIFFTTELDKILWEIQSITDTKTFNIIKNWCESYDKDPLFRDSSITFLKKIMENYKSICDCKDSKIKIQDPVKFKKLIEKLIEELKKDRD